MPIRTSSALILFTVMVVGLYAVACTGPASTTPTLPRVTDSGSTQQLMNSDAPNANNRANSMAVPGNSSGTPVDADIQPSASDATSADTLHVIVTLKVPFIPEGNLSPDGVRTQRAAIARAQEDLLAEMSSYHVIVVAQYKAVPQMVLEVDHAALQALTLSTLVAAVEEDIPVAPAAIP